MEVFNKALTEAIGNTSVEQEPLNDQEIDIIKKAIEIATNNGRSFFTVLYELTEQMKNEEQRNRCK